MSFYREHVLPPLLDLAMAQKELTARRAALIARAAGRTLEIGIGSGLNLPFYDPAVERLDGIDPSPALLRRARQRANAVPFPIELHEGSAEHLPFEAHVFETAVMTWTLCSVADPVRVLREVRRVLVPEGLLLFAEHGLAPEAGVAAWQHRLTPLWCRVAGGCHLDRQPDQLLRSAGFDIGQLTTGYMRGPRVMAWGTYQYQGQARPS